MQTFARVAAIVGAMALSLPVLQARAQSTAVRRATTPVSKARIDALLGPATTRASAVRVVRPSGAIESQVGDTGVKVAPGDFIFRKTSDTVRRVALPNTPPAPGSRLPQNRRQMPPPVSRGPVVAAESLSLSQATAPVPSVAANAILFALPYRFVGVDSGGTERLLVPYVIVEGGGLTYSIAAHGFRGTAFIGVEDSLHPRAGSVPLSQTLKLQFMTTSGGGTVAPRGLEIAHTGVEYDSIAIVSPEATQLRIATSADPAGIIVPIPLRSIAVGVSALQRSIQAFGLATTRIAVSLPRGMTRADTVLIVMSSTPSAVSPETVRVVGDLPALVRLRSGLPGRDSITALLDGIPTGGTSVTFVPPWSFVGATIVGLLLGGLARFFGPNRRKRARALPWDIARGAPFGVIAAVASALGLDLLQLKIEDPGTWIAVMLTTAVGAWAGSRLLAGKVAPAT